MVFSPRLSGPYRITKAFAPLIIDSKGRITTIGSINGIIAGPLSGPYAMSKFAVEGFTDALAAEMAELGVKVSIVDPGRFRSKCWPGSRRCSAGPRETSVPKAGRSNTGSAKSASTWRPGR